MKNKIKKSDVIISQVKSEILDSYIDGILESVKNIQRETRNNLMTIAKNDKKLYKILVELYTIMFKENL